MDVGRVEACRHIKKYVFCAFMPIWFKQVLRLSGAQIGTVFALNALMCMMTHPAYGFISDRIGQNKSILYFITMGMFFTGPFMVFVYARRFVLNHLQKGMELLGC